MFDKKYFRRYTLMSADSSLGGKVSGSFVTEVRNGMGTFIINVNMPNFSGIKPYIISCGDDRCIGVPVATDKPTGGRIYAKVKFDPDNVLDSGLNIEKFNVIAVIDEKSLDKSVVTSLLSGNFGDKVSWRHNFVPIENIKKDKVIKEIVKAQPVAEEKVIINPQPVATKQPEKTELPKAAKEETLTEFIDNIVPEKVFFTEPALAASSIDFALDYALERSGFDFSVNPHDTFKKMARLFREQLDELEKEGILTPWEAEEIKGIKTQEIIPQEIIPQKPTVDKLFEENQNIIPFVHSDKGRWIQIKNSDLKVVPNIERCFMAKSLMDIDDESDSHLILGRYKDEGNDVYYIGIPGKYTSSNKQNNVYFGAAQNRALREGSAGYWIYRI